MNHLVSVLPHDFFLKLLFFYLYLMQNIFKLFTHWEHLVALCSFDKSSIFSSVSVTEGLVSCWVLCITKVLSFTNLTQHLHDGKNNGPWESILGSRYDNHDKISSFQLYFPDILETRDITLIPFFLNVPFASRIRIRVRYFWRLRIFSMKQSLHNRLITMISIFLEPCCENHHRCETTAFWWSEWHCLLR